MRAFSIALVTATGLLATTIAVEAKTTRNFSGSSPAEVEQYWQTLEVHLCLWLEEKYTLIWKEA